LKENRNKPEELVVMSWAGGWGRALWEAVSQPFTQWTGIPVRQERQVGLKLPPSLLYPLQKRQRPPFDIVWSNAVPAMRVALDGGCDPLDEATVPNLALLHGRAIPLADGRCPPLVSPYIVYYVLTYRTSAFPEGRPDSWEVMLEPRFKGKVALYPGGNGFFPLAQVMGGGSVGDIPRKMEPCWDFFQKFKPQVGQLDYSVGMGERIRQGKLDLCFRALTNALAFREEGLEVHWAAPREGIPDTADALWVPANLPEHVAYWAKRYIDFALSREVQERWCALLGAMPLNRHAAVPEIFLEDPTLPKSPDDFRRVLHISDAIKARHEEEWENHFNRLFSSRDFEEKLGGD
jgi:putative spermidine/putrescine transport system substrate-binding protein